MVSPNHYFGRQLKPDVIAIDDQDQIIILDLLLVVEKIVHPANLARMASLIPSRSIEDLAVVDQCRRWVAEDERGEQRLAEVWIRFGCGYYEVEGGIGLLKADGCFVDWWRQQRCLGMTC